MKKLIDLLVYLLVFSILIFLTLLLNIYSNKNDITQSAIETYIASNDNYNLIKQILKDVNKKDLIKFIDYIELDINQSIENDKYNYTSFTITLPQNKSFIALYKKNNDNKYIFCSLIDNLYSVDNFYFYDDFFIVEESVDNPADSKNNKEFVEVFFNRSNMFISVLIKDTYKEIIDEDNRDCKTILSASIDFLEGDITKILYVSTYKIINTPTKINTNPEGLEKNSKTTKEIYIWNPDLNSFNLLNKEIIDNK